MWRIRDRATFSALRRARRATRGLLTVAWLPDEGPGSGDSGAGRPAADGPGGGSPLADRAGGGSLAGDGPGGRSPAPPRLAFAISRKVGPAVSRNRVRRRLRELARQTGLAPGAWLVIVSPGAASAPFATLASWWSDAVAALDPGPLA